ncbi:DUF916 domain-containing protein [Microbacterium sp. M28]|uniref:DUF916 domain-containing protein n=1 Tax=Microbacterium sp. M28 TaxID=2962064 RepID=UPI0021F41A6C|nr:DUF916 domain-containing protein [Microbacterium sp. M28]UYO96286.1 DUF916 domain-containing protein [Microbacterium sp. M28]
MSRFLPRRPGLVIGAGAAAALVLLTTVTTSALSARADTPLAASAAAGSGDVAWSMMPVITDVGEERSNFSYALEPGAAIEDAVLVRNSGAAELTLGVYGSDAYTDDAGALDVSAAEAGATGVGGWITAEAASIRLAPGEVVRLPFTVTVPPDAQPGEHAGALLTVRESVGDTVSVDMRYATRVTVTVAGELTAGFAVDRPQVMVSTGFWPWDRAVAAVDYTVRNTGNTRLSAVQLITAPGVELYSTPDAASGFRSLAELLPDAEVDVHAAVDGLSAWSPIIPVEVAVSPTVLVTNTDSPPTVAQERVALSALAVAPGWWVLAVGAGLIVFLVALVAVRTRRRPTTASEGS